METAEQQSRTNDPGAATGAWIVVRVAAGEPVADGMHRAVFGHRLGAPGVADADGIFAGWDWDGRRLVACNDRYGLQPLFHANLPGGGVAVSPSIIRLIELGASTAFDLEALSIFFRLGHFLGEDTPFQSIRTVPPNAVFEWVDGKLTCRARYPVVPQEMRLTRDDAIDRYIELFSASIRKRLPTSSRFGVTLSGGRDSRQIVLELHRQGFRPQACVSALDHPPNPNEDPEVAAALCARLGLRHVIVTQRLSRFAAEAHKNRRTHFCSMAHGWYLALADFLDGQFDCVHDGIGGDVLSQSKLLTPELDAAFHSGHLHTICDALFARHASNLAGVERLVRGELRACLDPALARRRFARELGRHLDWPNPVASFVFWNRTRREIALAPFGILQGVQTVYAPYLDHDLFDFTVSLPSKVLLNRRFHDEVISRAYPACADIPYARNAPPHSDDREQRVRFLDEVARRFLLHRPSRLMKNAEPRARILAGVLSRGLVSTWVSPLIVYLDQVETIIGKSPQRQVRERQITQLESLLG